MTNSNENTDTTTITMDEAVAELENLFGKEAVENLKVDEDGSTPAPTTASPKAGPANGSGATRPIPPFAHGSRRHGPRSTPSWWP